VSDLLNDSPTAVKFRDRILPELQGEQVLFVAEGQVMEPTGSGAGDFRLYIGAIIVTDRRLLVAEGKAFGRVTFQYVEWGDVQKNGRDREGKVAIQKSGRWPIWQISIWEGKSYKTPLDRKSLDLLSLSIEEAYQAVRTDRVSDSVSAYEELKRRRGQ
jgi:hypothetical protein